MISNQTIVKATLSVVCVLSWGSCASAMYDPYIGRFASRDPIGFGGGSASIFEYCHSAAPNYMDPTGKQIKPFAGPPWAPFPYPTSPLPPIWPAPPKGVPPPNPFGPLSGMLDGMCAACCEEQYCKCGGEGNKLQKAVDDTWNQNWGNGPLYPNKGKGDDSVGGYYCTEWANFLYDALSNTPLNSGCFSFARRESFKTDGSGKMHAWVQISVGKGGPGCELNIDDGWGNGTFVNMDIPVADPTIWSNPETHPEYEHKSYWEKFWENYHPFGW